MPPPSTIGPSSLLARCVFAAAFVAPLSTRPAQRATAREAPVRVEGRCEWNLELAEQEASIAIDGVQEVRHPPQRDLRWREDWNIAWREFRGLRAEGPLDSWPDSSTRSVELVRLRGLDRRIATLGERRSVREQAWGSPFEGGSLARVASPQSRAWILAGPPAVVERVRGALADAGGEESSAVSSAGESTDPERVELEETKLSGSTLTGTNRGGPGLAWGARGEGSACDFTSATPDLSAWTTIASALAVGESIELEPALFGPLLFPSEHFEWTRARTAATAEPLEAREQSGTVGEREPPTSFERLELEPLDLERSPDAGLRARLASCRETLNGTATLTALSVESDSRASGADDARGSDPTSVRRFALVAHLDAEWGEREALATHAGGVGDASRVYEAAFDLEGTLVLDARSSARSTLELAGPLRLDREEVRSLQSERGEFESVIWHRFEGAARTRWSWRPTEGEATGGQATGGQATGDRATGDRATGDRATGDRATSSGTTTDRSSEGQSEGGA